MRTTEQNLPVFSKDQHYHSTIYDQDRTWKIHLSPKASSSIIKAPHPFLIAKSYHDIETKSDPRYDHKGTCEEHLHTMNFLLDHWPEILDILNPARLTTTYPLFEPTAHPEVFLTYPIFDGTAGRALDFVGTDENGSVYIIEIGRRQKFSQIEKQLYLARLLFPDQTVHGLIAKYTKKTEDSYRLYFRYH